MAYIVKTRFQCSITTVRRCDVMRAVLETACDVAVLDDTLDDDALIGTGRAITGVGCGLVICATRSAGQARNLACLDCPVVFKPFSDLRFCDAIEAAVRALRIRN
ncbi:MAG: hypothetical protein KDJ77_07065 [Rhodobiaceae bacterium]|nr:hypothetical protein [Rhodobiaceae bacterium]